MHCATNTKTGNMHYPAVSSNKRDIFSLLFLRQGAQNRWVVNSKNAVFFISFVSVYTLSLRQGAQMSGPFIRTANFVYLFSAMFCFCVTKPEIGGLLIEIPVCLSNF